jgi:hypothetical protein
MRPYEPWMYSDAGCSWVEKYNHADHYEMWDVLSRDVSAFGIFSSVMFVNLCFES